MKISELAKQLNIANHKALSGLDLYYYVRRLQFAKFKKLAHLPFQSPSVSPSTSRQRSLSQIESEHSVYQRSDFTPLTLEKSLNTIFPKIGEVVPFTLMFNSGMAAISSVAYFLYGHKKIKKLTLGENVYFETKWLIEDYRKFRWFNEYTQNLVEGSDAFWFEYPINCTQPDKYPFNQQLDLKSLFLKLNKLVANSKRHCYVVIDYTLSTLPFDVSQLVQSLSKNLTIILITSLQKHRGLGLDLTNAGAVTVYSHSSPDDAEYFSRIRAIQGGLVTQETQWLMPAINPKLINQIIVDSGLEARKLFNIINRPNLPIKFYCAENDSFQTSFIFVKIERSLMKKSTAVPYFSDQFISELVASAKRHRVTLIQGTSFGFPFTRIFKNSERYDNTSSLRIAVGYDPDMNLGLGEAIIDGVDRFIKKHL